MSPPPPVPSAVQPHLPPTGSLATTAPDVVLRFCEVVRFSGTLTFESPRVRGVLPLLAGAPEIPAGDARVERALDDFLALGDGSYTLAQLLPSLEGAAADGPLALRGSLEGLSVADLLRYCEGVGLSGSLSLENGGRRCVARYGKGELVSITLEDGSDEDLNAVFAWTQGTFVVRAVSVFERERKVTRPDPAFLKSLEVALTDVLAKSESGAAKARPSGASSPLRGPSIVRGSTMPFGVEGASPEDAKAKDAGAASDAAGARGRVVPPPLPPPNPESTVKIYFRDKGPPPRASGTQHVAGKLGREEVEIPTRAAAAKAATAAEASGAAVAREERAGASEQGAPEGSEQGASEEERALSEEERALSEGEQELSEGEQALSGGERAPSEAEQGLSGGERTPSKAERALSSGERTAAGRERPEDKRWSAVFAAVFAVGIAASFWVVADLLR